MVTLPPTVSDEVILDLVRQWVAALSAGDFEAASQLLTAAGNERDWPAALVKEVPSTESLDSASALSWSMGGSAFSR